MSNEPEQPPRTWQLPRPLLGVLLGIALVALVPLAGLLLGDPPAGPTDPATLDDAFQPLAPRNPHPDTEQTTPRLEVLPGAVLLGSRRAQAHEAILRLHIYLALRDVHPGSISLDWRPALEASNRDAVLAERCGAPEAPPQFLATGVHPDPLGRAIDPGRDQRLFFLVGGSEAELQLEAIVCNRQGASRGQVLDLLPDREGEAVRELATWAAAITGSADPGGFATSWERAPAPGRPGLARYGEVLVASTQASAKPAALLSEASEAVPEAAWLLAHLGAPRDRAVHLQRAARGRESFTAAVEDRAALLLAEDQTSAAVRELSTLTVEPDSRTHGRPARQLLASRLLQQGRPLATLQLLETLTPEDRERRSAGRLGTLAATALERDDEARGWAEAWVQADPNSGEALLHLGRLRARTGDLERASAAWSSAARLDVLWRDRVLREWAEAAFDHNQTEELEASLDALADADGGEGLSVFGQELRAFTIARSGRPAEALALYDILVGLRPNEVRLHINRCAVALSAGMAGGCDEVRGTPLEVAMTRAAWDSRQAGLLPGYPRDTREAAGRARSLAPREPNVAHTVLHSLGPYVDEAEQEELLARWRVAAGAGVEAPLSALEPPGPNR